MPREHRLAILGLGHVGRALLDHLARHPDPDLRVVAAADRTGLTWSPQGLDPAALLAAKRAGDRRALARQGRHQPRNVALALSRLDVDAVVDLLPADYRDGGPSRKLLLQSLQRGVPCVTANKAPLALDFDGIVGAARDAGVPFEYTATVGGGLPIVPTLRHGLDRSVTRIEGILNATTHHLLSRLETGGAFDEELAQAQRHGLAEADPRNDLTGRDAAAKGVILHNTAFDARLRLRDVNPQALTPSMADRARRLFAQGRRLRSVATVTPGHVTVDLQELEAGHPLAAGEGSTVVLIHSPPERTIRLAGPGGGGRPTALAVLGDLGRLRGRPLPGVPAWTQEVTPPAPAA